jgi:hypothetical protein
VCSNPANLRHEKPAGHRDSFDIESRGHSARRRSQLVSLLIEWASWFWLGTDCDEARYKAVPRAYAASRKTQPSPLASATPGGLRAHQARHARNRSWNADPLGPALGRRDAAPQADPASEAERHVPSASHAGIRPTSCSGRMTKRHGHVLGASIVGALATDFICTWRLGHFAATPFGDPYPTQRKSPRTHSAQMTGCACQGPRALH